MDFKNAKTLTRLLKENEFDFKWLYGKCSAKAVINNKSTEFNIVMKARKDSAIWMSITDPLLGAVEVARVLLTCDSVRFMDRINKQYFIGGYDTLKKMMNVDDLDFEMLQSLMVGNSVEFYEEDERLKAGIDHSNCRYLLGTIRKRKLKKVLENGTTLKDPAQNIWLEPEKFKILRLFFVDFNTNRTFDAQYETFNPVDSLLFPHKMSFVIRAEHSLQFSIEFNKVSINKEQAFSFNIPSSYEKIQRQK